MGYEKEWLPLDKQVERLVDRGLYVEDHEVALRLLKSIGYYRLTGYLYPFLESTVDRDENGKLRTTVLSRYKPGTTLEDAVSVIDFDRKLRILTLEGLERIEVAMRMQIGYVLGRSSTFAHEDSLCFVDSFTESTTDSRCPEASRHVQWLQRVKSRKDSSDETFVTHFRDKYDDKMPIWALTELLEMGHLSTLYRGMRQNDAEEIAESFGAPTKKIMTSWLASLNYVRNVAAHHARLFNRKLQNAPARPKVGTVKLLDHLRATDAPKQDFGTYNALAIAAYLLRQVDSKCKWAQDMASLLNEFPSSHALTVKDIGAPVGWQSLELWQPK